MRYVRGDRELFKSWACCCLPVKLMLYCPLNYDVVIINILDRQSEAGMEGLIKSGLDG